MITEKQKVCYRSDGTKKTGKRIIKTLEKAGGVNLFNYSGMDTREYYYCVTPAIIQSFPNIPEGYTLSQLPAISFDTINEEQKQHAIAFAKWMAGFEITNPNGLDNLTLIDGNWYWANDDDGNQPLSEEQLYEWFLKTLSDASASKLNPQ